MTIAHSIRLMVDDPFVHASLEFSLSVEGFKLSQGCNEVLIIDEGYRGNGVAVLEEMRRQGIASPAIILTTHPNRQLRTRVANCEATLIEKPLIGDEISRLLAATKSPAKAA